MDNIVVFQAIPFDGDILISSHKMVSFENKPNFIKKKFFLTSKECYYVIWCFH